MWVSCSQTRLCMWVCSPCLARADIHGPFQGRFHEFRRMQFPLFACRPFCSSLSSDGVCYNMLTKEKRILFTKQLPCHSGSRDLVTSRGPCSITIQSHCTVPPLTSLPLRCTKSKSFAGTMHWQPYHFRQVDTLSRYQPESLSCSVSIAVNT